MYGRATSTKDCMRRSHRRQRESDVYKLPKMTDGWGGGGGGGGADRLRRKRGYLPPSQASLEEEEEEGVVVEGELSSWTKKQRARTPRVKSAKANEEPLDFTKVSSIFYLNYIKSGKCRLCFYPFFRKSKKRQNSSTLIRRQYSKKNIGRFPTDGCQFSAATSSPASSRGIGRQGRPHCLPSSLQRSPEVEKE